VVLLATSGETRTVSYGRLLPMDPVEIVGAYGASWNELDEEKRAALLDVAWADDGSYCDPTATVVGPAALPEHIAGFQAMFRGRTMDCASAVDVAAAGIRWAGVMRNGDTVELEGMDFAELAPDDRIRRIAGFFGPLPTLDP